MITMVLKGWKYGAGVTVEIRDVALKYYNFNTYIVDNLYGRFQKDQPSRILIQDANTSINTFIDKIIDEGYLIDSNGYVKHSSDLINQTVEEKDEQEYLELEFVNENDQLQAAQLLLKNNYVVSISQTEYFYQVNGTRKK